MKKGVLKGIIIAAVIIFTVAAGVLFIYLNSDSEDYEKVLRITGGDGTELTAPIEKADDIYVNDSANTAFVSLVLREALEIIGEKKKLSSEDAIKYLIDKGAHIETAFNKAVLDAVYDAYMQTDVRDSEFAFTACDENNALVCAFSVGEGDNISTPRPVFSSIKPLSVYSLALEQKKIHYSSMVADVPYKTITDENGESLEWPQNGVGYYTYHDVSVATAVKLSLNTVAVRLLKEVGIENSLDFLEDKLSVELSFERQKMESSGEDEILSNLAMGYLYNGITPVDMAGYYRMFSDKGFYEKPYSILKITDGNGKVIFEHESEKLQVLSEDTAFIMTKLLEEPFKHGGTAEKVRLASDIGIYGKTGTGDSYEDCWIVGVTPEYSMALWHNGESIGRNASSEVLAEVLRNLSLDASKKFSVCESVINAEYCSVTGMLAAEKCPVDNSGWYSADNMPEKCSLHN